MKGYRISVIRHGRTAANDKGIYIGRTDFPLSDKGAAELAGKMDELVSQRGKGVQQPAASLHRNRRNSLSGRTDPDGGQSH